MMFTASRWQWLLSFLSRGHSSVTVLGSTLGFIPRASDRRRTRRGHLYCVGVCAGVRPRAGRLTGRNEHCIQLLNQHSRVYIYSPLGSRNGARARLLAPVAPATSRLAERLRPQHSPNTHIVSAWVPFAGLS
ncbi:hypothetical protein GGS23DRAFT_352122 [Durotheca rogersii]|uniref:uncharacterized protein n=1 Tax=Durotheca rogersii TaxID=419775 RepID=UPI00221F95A5|nr:uncharacterized protein GGS23DRAFT_352122 [Durotheca rogersii]KAI5865724.1 hypothetical protein GGS23DRAFT_352122 [Durotheca rogersii]